MWQINSQSSDQRRSIWNWENGFIFCWLATSGGGGRRRIIVALKTTTTTKRILFDPPPLSISPVCRSLPPSLPRAMPPPPPPLLAWSNGCVCVHARFVPRKMVLSLSLSFPPPNNARVGRPRKRDEQWRECYITRVLRPGLRGGVAEGGRCNRFVVVVSHIWSHVPGLCPLNESFSYSDFQTEAPCTSRSLKSR